MQSLMIRPFIYVRKRKFKIMNLFNHILEQMVLSAIRKGFLTPILIVTFFFDINFILQYVLRLHDYNFKERALTDT